MNNPNFCLSCYNAEDDDMGYCLWDSDILIRSRDYDSLIQTIINATGWQEFKLILIRYTRDGEQDTDLCKKGDTIKLSRH